MDKDTLISTSSLFHYTRPEYLEQIIKNGFKPRVCWEDFDFQKSDVVDAWRLALGYSPGPVTKFTIGIPMICFCDIPLSLVTNHIKIYNSYGIALKKEWAVRHQGVCPVIYVSGGSEFNSHFGELYRLSQQSDFNAIQLSVLSIMRLLKPYMGFFEKGSYKNDNHKFYDEREWRYVPSALLCQPYFLKSETEAVNNFNDNIAQAIPFNADDIAHIIVKENKDVARFHKILVEKFGNFDKKKIVSLGKKWWQFYL